MDATKRATLHDVAALARVSHQTVSRVINDHPNVAPATRDRVNGAIRKLRYRPNAAARNLVTRRSRTVGIVSHAINFYGPSQMLLHVEASFRSRGYGLTLSNVATLSAQGLTAAIAELRSREVDGIVMITPVVRTDIDAVTTACSGVPFVMIDINLGGHAPSVVIDQRRGGELTAEHLIAYGHRRIAVVRGPSAWTGSVLRHAGLTSALKRAGIAPVYSEAGDWTPASGYRIAQRLISRGVPFTAVVAGNDEMALGVMRALHEHGMRVPDDVSVTGFDDVPGAAYCQPPLTTVHQDFADLGTHAATFLIDLVTEPTPATSLRQHVLTPRLVVRGSTGPAPTASD
jgi:DNA-binding LacI/PurR family transcriptional regulator